MPSTAAPTTSFAPCGRGFICVQLPCPRASPANNTIAITAAAEILAHMLVAPQSLFSNRVVSGSLFCSDRRCEGGERAPHGDRPHHVVIFVLKDMAMPDVLMAAGPRT